MKKLFLFSCLTLLLSIVGLGSARGQSYFLDYTYKATNNWGGADYTPSDLKIKLREKYETTCATVGDVMTQTISGLQNGTYDVEFYAAASYTSGRGFTWGDADHTTSTVVFAGDKSTPTPVVERGSVSNPDVYTVHGATVTDGTLNIGMRKDAEGSNWHIIRVKSIKLIYEGLPADGLGYDVTSNITNTDFQSNNTTGWVTNLGMQNNGNFCGYYAEKWSGSPSAVVGAYIKQNINIPNGKYLLRAQVSAENLAANLYAGDAQTAINKASQAYKDVTFTVPNTGSDVSVEIGAVATGVDGSGAGWFAVDNFTLTYLGQTVGSAAAAIPASTLEANTWYKYVVATDGDYKVVANTLSDIVYTTNGDQYLAVATGTVLDSNEMTLTAGTYYFMSTSAQTLAIKPNVKEYILGDATTSLADGSYIGAINTFTVTFADAATNDDDAVLGLLTDSPKATLTVDATTVEGAITASGNALTATFTGVELQQGKTYTLNVPAGIFGYKDGEGVAQVSNTAVSVSLNTGALADGTYYYYNETSKKFLSRGAAWGTEAVLDNYGVPATATILPTGKYTLTFVDNKATLYRTDGTGVKSAVYTDNSSNNTWDVSTATGGYVISDGVYTLELQDGGYIRSIENGTPLVWTLKSTAERNAIINAYPTANEATVKLAAGIDTEESLATYLAENYAAVDMKDKLGKWTYTETREAGALNDSENWNGSGSWTQTVTDLPEGLYKITVEAFNRNATAASDAECASYNVGTAYMSANGEQVRLATWNQVHAASGSTETNYPNNVGAGNSCFDSGYGINEVYAYVGADGNLELKLAKPSWIFDCWLLKRNWTLTAYEPYATAADIKALEDALEDVKDNVLGFEADEYAPYNNVDAVKALAAAKAIDTDVKNGQKTVQAATAALTGAIWTANAAEVNAIYDGDFTKYAYAETGANEQAFAWTGNEGHNNATDVRHQYYTESNPGMAGKEALFIKFGASYGLTEGYTMPLKANTVYKLTFTYGGWGTGEGNVSNAGKGITVTTPNGDAIELTPATIYATEGANANAEAWKEYTGVFTTDEAGDYVLNFNHKRSGGQDQYVFTNMELKKSPVASATMTITDAKWGTFVAPFEVTVPTGVTASTITGVEDNKLTLAEVDGVIPANTPVIINSESTVNKTFNGQSLAVKDSYTVGLLTGVYTATDAPVNSYVLQNQASGLGFYKVATEGIATVGANRAYLTLPEGANAPRFFLLDEETTGIQNVEATSKENVIYDITGRRVNNANGRGIYIINGKKVIK